MMVMLSCLWLGKKNIHSNEVKMIKKINDLEQKVEQWVIGLDLN